ncbi:putative ring finger [Lyophyllum shimeji]|uniref:Ring finger n=1 Tax=Lyophyllum shimeji TaxID=47721 RepID=A0A9P3PLC8_LYOSH|nr:putative ring finger [Lyophyllum shimeji]
MSLYNYVESPNSNLICCICRTPFTDPVTTHTCAHTFCKDCILRAIEHSAQCPVDRSPLGPGNLVPADPIVRSLVDELVVECVHRAEGCMYTCQRQLLPAHLLDSCDYREVPCPRGKCEETMPFKHSISHVHEDDNGDSERVRETDDRKPENPAEEASNPVSAADAAEALEATANRPSSSNSISSSSTSVDSSSAASHSRLATLAEQNILLRHRVETLESLLHSFKREMTAVKRALGPWIRVGEGMENGVNSARDRSYFSTELPVGAQQTSASTSNTTEGLPPLERLSPYHSTHPHHLHAYQYPFSPAAPAPAPAPMPPAESLAPYFPAELDDTAPVHPARRPPPPTPRTHRSSSSVEFMNSPAPGYDPHSPFPAPPLAPLVAPLNLGTTLEGTLHGLRESVVGLAASVDSMGRRHEIALTNETTRMGEEVGGLRAGIHGLRMQIHAIMMDRNAQLTGRDGVGDNGNGQWMPLPAPQPPTRPFHVQQPSVTKL